MGLLGRLAGSLDAMGSAAEAMKVLASATAETSRWGDESARFIAKTSPEFQRLASAAADVKLSTSQARAGGEALIQLPAVKPNQHYRYAPGTSMMGFDNVDGTAVATRAEDGALTLVVHGRLPTPVGAVERTMTAHLHRIDDKYLQFRLTGLGPDKPYVSKINTASPEQIQFTPLGARTPFAIRSHPDGALELDFALGKQRSSLRLIPTN